jgi:transcription elongation factor Elf1
VSIFDILQRHTVQCDNCGRRFRERLYDEPQRDGGLLRKFECPRCGQEYLVALYTPRGAQIFAQLQGTLVSDKKTIAKLRRALRREVRRP